MGPCRRQKLLADTVYWLDVFRLPVSPVALMGNLSTHKQQLVSIGRAMTEGVKLLILDEPTASLSERETELLFDRIADLHLHGVTTIYISHSIAYLPAERKRDGLIVAHSIESNMSLAALARFSRYGFIDRKTELRSIQQFAANLRVRCHSTEQPIRELSGGNQHKVVAAKWLLTEPKIFVLEEPTRGVDVNARIEFYHRINTLTSAGKAILLVAPRLTLANFLAQGRFRLIPRIAVLIVVWIVLEMLTGGLFLSARNLTNLSGQVAITAVLAAGAVLLMAPGYIDLSLGATVAASAVVAAFASTVYGFGFWPTVLITIGFGLVLGFWHAYGIVWMHVPSFIVTLASLLAIRGVSLVITNAGTISPSMDMLVISDASLPPPPTI